MGDFRVVIEASGGHGCERERGNGEHVYGCGMQGCPDCMVREFLRFAQFKGWDITKAELTHWPSDMLNSDGSPRYSKDEEVKDNLLTGIRTGSFPK